MSKPCRQAWPEKVRNSPGVENAWCVAYYCPGYEPGIGTRQVINRIGLFASRAAAQEYIARVWK